MQRSRGLVLALSATMLAGSALAGQSAPAAAATGEAGDGLQGPVATLAATPDRHERAATANNQADHAATKDRAPKGARPIVPQHKGTPATQVKESANQGAGLTGTTAPTIRAAAAPMAGVNGLSCQFATLEDAISAAAAGSTIYVAPGVYPAVTANVDYNIGKSLDIVKATASCQPTTGGSSTDVVLQRNASSTNDAVVEVYSSAVVRFDRITIEGGNSAEGTLYALSGAQVTLDDSIVRNGSNPSTSVGGGGVRVSGATTTLTSINDSQIENNEAAYGGGIYVDAGTVTINGTDNVELNTASVYGGGIYATNSASVVLANNADVMSNTATSRGGGVYLAGTSTLSATGAGTYLGFSGQGNSSRLGAGAFAEGGSSITIGDSAAVYANNGGYGAGLYGLGADTFIHINANGSVRSNSATVNGGGILVTQSAVADLNPGSQVSSNSSTGWGAGLAVFTPASLDADGGTPTVDPVLVSGNSAGTVGGGIWSSGTSNLDTVWVHSNSAATDGGGLYVPGGTVIMSESYSCGPSYLAFEHYCNEFRGNTAGATGGAVRTVGGTFTAVQTGFIGNSADQAAVVMATGASTISVKAALVIENTETVASEALFTAKDTTSITLVGLTSAAQSEYLFDTDGTGVTSQVSRVLTTTGTLSLESGTPTGGCNISAVSANLPGLLVVPIAFVTTSRTAYMPAANSPAIDLCATSMGGHNSDIDDRAVVDYPPPGGNDYDVGAFEVPAP